MTCDTLQCTLGTFSQHVDANLGVYLLLTAFAIFDFTSSTTGPFILLFLGPKTLLVKKLALCTEMAASLAKLLAEPAPRPFQFGWAFDLEKCGCLISNVAGHMCSTCP